MPLNLSVATDKLSNELLKEYYLSVLDIHNYKNAVHFKIVSKNEEIRSNNFIKCLELYQEKIGFFMSNKDTAVGRFFKDECTVLKAE